MKTRMAMNLNKYTRILWVVLLPIVVLCGCVSLSLEGDKTSSEIEVILISDSNINEDVLGVASPVRLTLLQLSSEIQFRQLPQMINDDKSYAEILGAEMLGQTQVMIRPNEFLDFKLSLSNKTKYLGVVTAYRDESNNWKSVFQKQDKRWYQVGDNYFLYLHVQSQGVVQLSKQEALDKILAFKLKEHGKSIEDFKKLTKHEQDKVLKRLEKLFEKPMVADMSKGYFSPSHTGVDMGDILKLKDDKNITDKVSIVD